MRASSPWSQARHPAQITRFGVTSGGHPDNQLAEHIGGTARVCRDED
jgi:hypothetical protein